MEPSPAGMTAHDLADWVPTRVHWASQQGLVDWCFMGRRRFSEPFFDQTIDGCLRLPFAQVFSHRSSIDDLCRRAASSPGVAPVGFIFHMSRCGSTLVSQILASDPANIVISEADPIDSVLGANTRATAATDEQRIVWLRALLAAYGQRRCGDEQRLFVKFDSWHIVDLELVQRAFPEVPCIFIYREPSMVLASHARQRGSHMIPGRINPARLGIEEQASIALDTYAAQVLAAICRSAVGHHDQRHLLLVNYDDLPSAVETEIYPYLGLVAGPAHRVAEIAGRHAKRPYEPFHGDTALAHIADSPAIRALTDQFVGGWFDELERRRLAIAVGV